MTATEAPLITRSASDLVKMDDRKRAATHDHSDTAPPLKRQAISANGGNKSHPDADMPWRDDLERIQKDAIWRQMQEYKREKISLETKLKEALKAATYHDDHLRVIDAWYNQLIDEVKLALGTPEEDKERPKFQSSLLFENVGAFEDHLRSRSDDIRDIISRLVSNSPEIPPEVSKIRDELTRKLAEEKAIIAELEKALSEKQQLEERLESASLRYMVAEKKLDRARSATVAKLEKQYIFGPQRPSGDSSSSAQEDQSPANGVAPGRDRSAEIEEAYAKLAAVSKKQKEQLQQLEAENSSLLSQLTDLKTKHTRPTDDDYAHTSLFKRIKTQYEDVVRRINHLEMTNIQLREEAEKLRSERIAYRNQVDEETRGVVAEKEAQLVRAEADLARIRNARDELLADQQMRKAAQEQEKTSMAKVKELADAAQAQILSFESEVERLRLETDRSKGDTPDPETVPVEELRSKYNNLERQYAMLNTELNSMQMACKKYSSLASQKVGDFAALEEKVARLIAEKSKADQKYFAAMKCKEAREQEVRILRVQNSKSSDIVAQLKESEATTRSLLANMEKLVSESKEALNSVINKNRTSQQQVVEHNITIESLKAQISELKTLSASKDSTMASISSAHRKAETEVEGLKATLSDTKKSLESWKSKSLGNSSTEYEMLRTLAICTVCRKNFKDTAIKTCGHVFCKDCVEERLTSRSRKCPNCNRSFGNNDYMHITL